MGYKKQENKEILIEMKDRMGKVQQNREKTQKMDRFVQMKLQTKFLNGIIRTLSIKLLINYAVYHYIPHIYCFLYKHDNGMIKYLVLNFKMMNLSNF